MTSNLREANRSWESLMSAYAQLMRRFANESLWRTHALSLREYDVLYTLSKCSAPARMGELRNGVLLSQPALSRLVSRLVARNLVQRVADTVDGRAVRVALTSEGAELQRNVGRSHARSVAQAMSALTPAEQRELARLTQKLQSGSTAPAAS